MQNDINLPIINYETTQIRSYYELNSAKIQEKTPSSKKIRVFKSPVPFTTHPRRDLFYELISESPQQTPPQTYQHNPHAYINSDNIKPTQRKVQPMQKKNLSKVLENEFQKSSQFSETNFIRSNLPSKQISSVKSAPKETEINLNSIYALDSDSQKFKSEYDIFDDKQQGIRKRKRKNNHQLQVLKVEFEKAGYQIYWNKDRIQKVSRVTGLSESQVYKWCWDQKKKKMENFKRVLKFQNSNQVENQRCESVQKEFDFDSSHCAIENETNFQKQNLSNNSKKIQKTIQRARPFQDISYDSEKKCYKRNENPYRTQQNLSQRIQMAKDQI